MPKKVFLVLAVLYTVALTIASLITLKSLPELGTDMDDKLYHVLAYLILYLIWYFAVVKSVNKKQLMTLAVICIVFGIIIEAIQGKVNVNRMADSLDVVANIIGVLFGFVLSLKWIHRLS
ncbi:MAG: VanZ family protein [Bacteroidia bacterium]|nr:VanZ family protein [Bacteroidia bacterium]MBT8268812.1 VanZ family protein [Bacteroidia bacterium]NNF81885.1 VanZ family protein [Flavobacteriaceae bacterium]NNK70472.1 VanZ family protein [Flavobacteriaceae bacterium]NNL80641.1 VanZ family protein [Flavobacteriaceae bacterium]